MTTFVTVSGVTAFGRICLCLITSEERVLTGSVLVPARVRLCESMSLRAIAPVPGCLWKCLNLSMGVDLM